MIEKYANKCICYHVYSESAEPVFIPPQIVEDDDDQKVERKSKSKGKQKSKKELKKELKEKNKKDK